MQAYERILVLLCLHSAPRSEALPEVEVDSESQFVFVPATAVRPSARTQSGFVALDTERAGGHCSQACVMKVPPAFLRGAYKSAMRLALQETVSGMELQNQQRISRGWKLFIFVSRNFVVLSGTRWQSTQERASRSSSKICERRVG